MKPHEIERHQALPHQAEIVLQLDPSLFWFSGHFSVQPLLPGVAQLNWAMDYATTLLAPGWRFHSIQKATVTLSLSWQEARQMLSFSYQRHDGDVRHTASSGKIRLCR